MDYTLLITINRDYSRLEIIRHSLLWYEKKAERQKGSFVTNANDAIIDMKKYAKVQQS